jgi:hypothetical protein
MGFSLGHYTWAAVVGHSSRYGCDEWGTVLFVVGDGDVRRKIPFGNDNEKGKNNRNG